MIVVAPALAVVTGEVLGSGDGVDVVTAAPCDGFADSVGEAAVLAAVVIAFTAGIFSALCNCDACSIAWIIIVPMSDPAEAGVEVGGVVVVAPLSGVSESRVAPADFPVVRLRAAVAPVIGLLVVKVVTVTPLVAGVLALVAVPWAEFLPPRGVKAGVVPVVSGFAEAVVPVAWAVAA